MSLNHGKNGYRQAKLIRRQPDIRPRAVSLVKSLTVVPWRRTAGTDSDTSRPTNSHPMQQIDSFKSGKGTAVVVAGDEEPEKIEITHRYPAYRNHRTSESRLQDL